MRNYAHEAVVGKTYHTDNGNVRVIRKIDNNHFEVAYINPKTVFVPELNEWIPFTDLGTNYIVDDQGHFGSCWNNPQTLCHLD